MKSELHIGACPSTETLSQLVSGTVVDADSLEVHLRSCAACQTKLDDLSQSDMLRPFRRNESLHLASDYSYLNDPVRKDDLGSLGELYIESEIGRGGAGVVFRALDPALDRFVAVKVLNNQGSFGSDVRFERESKAAGNLRNDYLVSVHSTGRTQDGRPYLVMPLIRGTTLKTLLQNEIPDARKSASIIRQIALGLDAVHSSGLVHRDVKSANILIDRDDNRAKLTDFGLARQEMSEATLTQADVLCGTPEYMSPEQISGSELTYTSDIYGLGITLCECLTGAVPFRGRPLDVLAQHRQHEPVPPSRLNKSVPRDLETICLKAIEKEPGRRYQKAIDLADDLQRFLDGKPIQARPASVPEKTWRWAKRNPRVALLTIALATALVGGILMTTWQWQSSRANYVEAQANYVAARENFDAATELVLNKTQFAFRLSHEVGHEIAARDLYRQVLQDVDQLVVFRSDDPAIRLLQPKVYLSNALIESAVGNAEDSIELFNTSIRMFQELIEEELEGLRRCQSQAESDQYLSSIEQLRQHHAGATILRGEAYHQIGDWDNAVQDYRTAQKILNAFLKDVSSNTRGWQQRNLALAQVLEGHVWSDLGENDKAFDCYQTAFQTLPNKLGTSKFAVRYSEAKNPDLILTSKSKADSAIIESVDKHIHAFVAHFFGRHLVATARNSDNTEIQIGEGTRLLTWSLEIRRTLSTENFAQSDRKRDVAMTLTELAKAAQQSGQFDLADEQISESIEILDAMVDRSERLEFRLRLAQALIVRSNLPDASPEEKVDDLIRARELCQDVLAVSPSWRECQRVLATISNKLAENAAN